MKSYISEPKSVRKSEIENKFYSLLAAEHRKVEVFNNNQKSIGDLVDFENVGEQIEVREYLGFKSEYYLGTISCMDSLIYNKTKGECVSPYIFKQSKKKLKKGDVVISRNASLGKISYVDDDSNVILNGGLSYLRFKNEFKYYSIAFFIVNYGAEYLTCLTSGGGTQQNAKRQSLLELKIPFPTKNNHPEPQKIEQLVSLIVQNIINKEERIKAKNQKIDELIEKELKENQNPENSFKYSYPKISEIKQESRLDTGIYEREFKEIDFLIRNYERGCVNFEDSGFKRKKGPNLAISVIGRSYYSDVKYNQNFKQLILSKHVTNEGGLKTTQYIGSSTKLPTLKRFDFLLFARGDIGRVILIDDFLIGATSNFDVFFISSKKRSWENIFTLCYLKYLRGIGFWEFYGVGGSGASSLTDYYFKKVNLPNFPESKQQEIAKEYYNQVDKNQKTTLGNYLEKETARNQQIGIFQLNMEIFTLREKLEDILDKIINETPIEINLAY